MIRPSTARNPDLLATIEDSEITNCFQGDGELLETLIGEFRRQTPKLLSEIQQSLKKRDGTALQRAAHKLKGSTAIFGTTAAFEAARLLEAAAGEGAIDRAAAAFECVCLTQFELDDAFVRILSAA